MSDTDTRQSLWTGRGIVSVLAVLPLVLTGFVIGYGVGSGENRLGDTFDEAWQGGNGTADHAPLEASFTATEVAGPAPESPAVLPVGFSKDLGIAVAHLQFAVDESTVRPDHTAELRLPVSVPPDSEGMTIEVASVYPVSCLCDLTAATAPPYGKVWDVVEIDASATEVVLDVTGAINAPGRYGFAVTTPDRRSYLELEGSEYGAGPNLRTVSKVPPMTSPPTTPVPNPPTAPMPNPAVDPTAPSPTPSQDPSVSPDPSGTPGTTPSAGPTVVPGTTPSADPTVIPDTTPSADPTVIPGTTTSPVPNDAPSLTPATDPSPTPGTTTSPVPTAPAPMPPANPALPVANPNAPLGPPQWPESGQAEEQLATCTTGDKLIPTCGALVGVAPAAHTSRKKERELLEFESRVDHPQQIYHAYERGDGRLFPTKEQIALTEDPLQPRTLLINWKPQMAEWRAIAEGDRETDAYLDRLAAHIKANFHKPFFFTVHHEPENDVDPRRGSGMEAKDYAAMYRYVVERLRGHGVDNLVTVMNYMGYLKWVEKPWHEDLYPGEDVVDWIGLSGYGQSLKDDGHSDFGEIVDQTNETAWPGFYHWVARQHPDKPMMLAEWGVFHMNRYPDHQKTVFEEARYQMAHYPRLKAIVYFESPNAEGRNSEVHLENDTLGAFRDLMRSPYFDVRLEWPGS
jgi:hypothetical protein